MKNKGESPKILINVMKKTFVQFIFSIIFVSISAANDSHAQGILNQKISMDFLLSQTTSPLHLKN